MRYTHLTENERYMISALRKQGISTAKIAKQLGRHKATIYREIERNSRYNRHFKRYSYQAWRAQQMARNWLSRSRRNKRYSEIDFRLPEALLRLDWSPDQIVGYLRVRGYPTMSHELIYQYVWNDKTLGGTLWKHQRQSTKKRRKRYNSK
ncbi:transposase, partial [Vibrio parahaemolyticus]